MRRRFSVTPMLPLALVAAACSDPEPEIHRFAGQTMGSTYEVKFVGATPMPVVEDAVRTTLAQFDEAFSKWRQDSEILRCNRAATTEPFAASPLFLHVLQCALDVAELTEGAFDPTVEPLLALYRQAKADGVGIDADALARAGARVGYRHVSIRDGAVHRTKAGIELDLDGIVAGACLDALRDKLTAMKVAGFYLEVTGEIYCGGEKAPGTPWVIGVVDPRSDLLGGSAAATTMPLRDRALCTSGDYRNAFVSDGKIIHHVFDPRSGQNADSAVVSASVVCRSAATADAVSTAMLVLGEQAAASVVARLRERGPIGVLLLVPDGQEGLRQVKFEWPE